MGYTFIPYLTALLVVLSIARYAYMSKFIIGENVTKSWPSAFLFIFSLIFSVLYIFSYFA
ncbi:hypothetical protein D3C86_2202130 [compost metagenome]